MAYPDVIADAIEHQRVLELHYKDVERKVRPHIFGIVGDAQLALSAWQVSGTGQGWRLFHLDDIRKLSGTKQRFHGTAPGYNPDDLVFSRILNRIDKPPRD